MASPKTWSSIALPLALAMHSCASDAGDAAAPGTGARDAGADNSAASDGASASTGGLGCTDTIAPTSASVATVLQRSCGLSKSCHAGDTAQQGLDLSSLETVFATAVGKPAKGAPTALLVAPGDPAKSYLLQKVLGTQEEGTSMPPPPAAALCEAKIKAIEGWIRAGAPRAPSL